MIDLACIHGSIISFIKRIKVEEEMFSDHMPITLSVVTEYTDYYEEVLPLLPKLLWNCQDLCVYQRKMDLGIANIDYKAISLGETKFAIDIIKLLWSYNVHEGNIFRLSRHSINKQYGAEKTIISKFEIAQINLSDSQTVTQFHTLTKTRNLRMRVRKNKLFLHQLF